MLLDVIDRKVIRYIFLNAIFHDVNTGPFWHIYLKVTRQLLQEVSSTETSPHVTQFLRITSCKMRRLAKQKRKYHSRFLAYNILGTLHIHEQNKTKHIQTLSDKGITT